MGGQGERERDGAGAISLRAPRGRGGEREARPGFFMDIKKKKERGARTPNDNQDHEGEEKGDVPTMEGLAEKGENDVALQSLVYISGKGGEGKSATGHFRL